MNENERKIFEALGLKIEGRILPEAVLPRGFRALYSEGSNPELPVLRDDGAFRRTLHAVWYDEKHSVVRARLEDCDGYGHEVVVRGVVPEESREDTAARAEKLAADRAALPTDQYGNVLDGGEMI